MMKLFEEPIVEVMTLSLQDIVTTSTGTEPTLPQLVGPCV